MVRKTDHDMIVEMHTILPLLKENLGLINGRVKNLETRMRNSEQSSAGQWGRVMGASAAVAATIGAVTVIIVWVM